MILRNASKHGPLVGRLASHHIAMFAAITVLGCGSGEDAEPYALDDTLAQQASALDAGSAVAPYLTEIKANGTGCPQGTWKAEVSPDGTKFRVIFSAYEAVASNGQRSAVKDCQLSVRMRSASPFSFAVTKLAYSGYAFLETGVRGYQIVSAYFAGAPVPPAGRENRTDLTGPLDRRYLYEKIVPPEDLVWAPCGVDRNLNVSTRIGVMKTQSEGTGYINLSAAYFPGDDITWQLATRPCKMPVRDAGPPADAGTSLDAGTTSVGALDASPG
ncbi:MAG: DUF4360 domain-containing protein [Polyangiales bacterium]